MALAVLPKLALSVAVERFPIAGAFVIARGARTEAVVVTATVSDGRVVGRGEGTPYARYGETVEAVAAALRGQAEVVAAGGPLDHLTHGLSGAAANALDCALWDYVAKRAGIRVWDLLGRPAPRAMTSCFTLSLGEPAAMEAAARLVATRPLLKVKLGGEGDCERIAAVRRGAPAARLVVDANEAWNEATLERHMGACADAGVELVEQPLPAGQDHALAGWQRPVPVCADESIHGLDSLAAVAERYDAINIKLDKTGGLTGALALAEAAAARALPVMVGCMLATSLAMAPALVIATSAAFVDLDGPLLLARDRTPALRFDGSTVHPPTADLWG